MYSYHNKRTYYDGDETPNKPNWLYVLCVCVYEIRSTI